MPHLTGYVLGVTEGLMRYYYPPLSDIVVFIIMTAVLLTKPAGLFGKGVIAQHVAAAIDSRVEVAGTLSGRSAWVLLAVSVAALAIAPHVMYPAFLIKVLCFAVAASAVNLLLGYTGMLSFGHAMFFGFSAYAAGHMAKVWGFAPEWAILGATLASVVLGALVGVIAIRLQGIYFAMSTLALAQMVYFFCLQAPFTGGEDGIQNIPRSVAFGLWDLKSDVSAYYFVLLICGAAILMVARLVHSPYGRIVAAVRDSEPRATSLGYNANRYRLEVFVLRGHHRAGRCDQGDRAADRDTDRRGLADVGRVPANDLGGGLGTISGPVIGALLLISMETYMSTLRGWVTVAQGAVFCIVVLAFRAGIVGSLSSIWDTWTARSQERAVLLERETST